MHEKVERACKVQWSFFLVFRIDLPHYNKQWKHSKWGKSIVKTRKKLVYIHSTFLCIAGRPFFKDDAIIPPIIKCGKIA